MESRFGGEFLVRENIGAVTRLPGDFSSTAYEPPTKKELKHPDESDYGKWKSNDYDGGERLEREYERHMEEKKRGGRVRLLAVVGVLVVLLAAIMVLFVIPLGSYLPVIIQL